MTEAEIYSALTDIFHEIFDDSVALTPQTTADDIPDWDSHNHISIIVATEMRFGIKFQTAELESLRNVGELVQRIEAKLNGS